MYKKKIVNVNKNVKVSILILSTTLKYLGGTFIKVGWIGLILMLLKEKKNTVRKNYRKNNFKQ